MIDKNPLSRTETRDKRQRFSIRKFNVGVASVAVAAFFMVNGSSVSADSIETTVVDVVETVEASEESLEVSDEEPELVQEIVETAVEEIPAVEELVDEPSQALEEVRDAAEEISTTELETVEETGVATEKQETVETDKVVEEENTKSEPAPFVQERSAQVVESRVAPTSYRVRYVDEETGQVVYQRNYTTSQETSASQEVANDFEVTVALELETATALSGYSLSENQEVTIRDNAIEAIVSERNNRLTVKVRRDDVAASDGEASDGFSALRAEEEKTETEQKAEEVNKELKETAELISGRNSNLTISPRYEQAMYLESMDQYLADQKARMEQAEIQATAERNRYAANQKIVQTTNDKIKAKAQEVNQHELIRVVNSGNVNKHISEIASFENDEINKLQASLDRIEAALKEYEKVAQSNADIKARNAQLETLKTQYNNEILKLVNDQVKANTNANHTARQQKTGNVTATYETIRSVASDLKKNIQLTGNVASSTQVVRDEATRKSNQKIMESKGLRYTGDYEKDKATVDKWNAENSGRQIDRSVLTGLSGKSSSRVEIISGTRYTVPSTKNGYSVVVADGGNYNKNATVIRTPRSSDKISAKVTDTTNGDVTITVSNYEFYREESTGNIDYLVLGIDVVSNGGIKLYLGGVGKGESIAAPSEGSSNTGGGGFTEVAKLFKSAKIKIETTRGVRYLTITDIDNKQKVSGITGASISKIGSNIRRSGNTVESTGENVQQAGKAEVGSNGVEYDFGEGVKVNTTFTFTNPAGTYLTRQGTDYLTNAVVGLFGPSSQHDVYVNVPPISIKKPNDTTRTIPGGGGTVRYQLIETKPEELAPENKVAPITVTYRTATLDDKVEQYTLRYNTVSAKEPEKTGDVIVRYIPVDEYGVRIGRRVMNQRITGYDGGTYDVTPFHHDTIELDNITYQRVDIDGTNPQPYTSDAPEQGVFINGEDQVVRYYYEPVIKRRGSVYALYQDREGKELKPAELVVEDVVRTSYDTSPHRPETLEVDGEIYYLVTVDSLMTDGTPIRDGIKQVETKTGEGDEAVRGTAETKGEITQGKTNVTYVYAPAIENIIQTPIYGNVVIHYTDRDGNIIKDSVLNSEWVIVANLVRTLVTDPNGNILSDSTAREDMIVSYDVTGEDKKPTTILTIDNSTYRLIDVDGEEEGILTGEEQSVTYIYEIVTGDVEVHYNIVDKDGIVLVEDAISPISLIKGGVIGEEYDTEVVRFENLIIDDRIYRFIPELTIGEETGKVEEGISRIDYNFRLVTGDVETHYHIVDRDGEVIVTDAISPRKIVADVAIDESYSTISEREYEITVDDKLYRLVNSDNPHIYTDGANEEGLVTEGVSVVNYYYEEVKGDVVVYYVDEFGRTIKESVVDTPETSINSPYDTIDNKLNRIITPDSKVYELVPSKTIGNETGVVIEGRTEVTYVYRNVNGDVNVRYFAIDEDGTIAPLSGEVLDLVDKTVVNVSEPATSLVEAGTLYDTTSLKPEIIYATNGEVWYLVNDLTEGEETGQVEAGITKTVNYFYKQATPVEEVTEVLGQVVIHYVDKAGNPIRDDYYDSRDVVAYTMYRYYEVTPNGDVINSSLTSGTNPEATYDTTEGDEKPEIIVTEAGLTYRLVDVEGEEQGYIGEGVTHVTYIYDLAVGSVAVHYHIVDKDGTLLLENAWSPRSVEQAVGDSYSTLDLRADELSFIGKSFRLVPERTDGVSETGTVTEGTQIINYYYTEVLPEPQIIEVIKEVEVEKIVEVTKEVPVEVIKEIPVEVIREIEVEKIVEVIQEVPVEVIKEIPVEVIREIEVEKIVEVIQEVPVEVIKEIPVEVIQEVPVEVIKEIPVEVIREVEVEKIVEVIQEVPVEVIKEIPVEVIREIEVEKIVEVIQEVPVEVIKEIPVEVIREIEVEKIVEVIQEVPVEVIREIEVEKIVEVIKEVEVDQPRPTVTTIYRQVANGVEEVEVTELGGQTSERVLTTYTNSRTTERLPYISQRQEDANLASGLEEVRQAGRDGQVVSGTTYTVENGRLVVSPVHDIIQPVPEIIAFGTKVTEAAPEPSQSQPEQEETPVGEDYRGELVAKKEDLQDRLAGIDAEISLAEDLLREEAVYSQVLSDNLTHLQGDLVSVQDRLTQVNADLASLRSDLAGVDSKIASREAELEELKANSPHAQLLTEISQIEASIKTKNDRIADINSLLPQKRAELEALRDEAGLDARIAQQQAAYDKLVAEQEAAQKAVNDKKASREAKRQTQQAAIDQMKAKLLTLGEKVTTVTNEDIFLDVPVESYRKKSQDAWERNVRDNVKNTVKQELVRFTGDRDEVVELTAAQAKEYQETGKFTYVPNEAQVEKFFYQYLKEIRQNNGIAIPLEESAEATDYSRRRARENAALNGGAGKLTHDTNQPDKQTAGYENAGLLVLGERFKSDQEVAYYLAFNWFSDYTNVGKNQAVNGGYGHRNNLLLGSHMADKTTGAVQRLATDHGNGLGFHQSSAVDTSYDYNLKYQEKWWHYLQNGYRYTWEAGLSPIAISRDAQNNQYLEINGKKTPTVFMDALTFKYVIKGQTETFVNQAYVNLEKQIEQAERALRLSLEHCDEELARLEAQVPDLTAAAQALADLKETKKQLPAKRQQLEADIKALETERSQHEAALANLTQLLATKTAELKDDTSLQRQRELEKELAELRSQRQELQEAIATKERERDDLIVQEQDLTQDIARLEEEILAHNQGVADFENLLSITRLKHTEIEDYIVVVEDLIDDLDNYDQRNRLGNLEEAQVLIAPTPEDKPQPVERPEPTVEEEVPAEEEISAIPDYAPEAEALPEYVFNPDDFKDVLPAEEEKPAEPELVEENPVEESVVETQPTQPKPLPRSEQAAQATGGVAAASTIQPVSHQPQAPLAQETDQATLPATGDAVSLVALLGAGMTATGLVELKRRRR